MMVEDHGGTDGGNLWVRWEEEVKAVRLGTRIVGNALAAYWLFQGWGNDYDQFAAIESGLREAIEGRQQDYQSMEKIFWAVDRWEFFAPTYPLIYFLNTRTNRGCRDGLLGMDRSAPAYLKNVQSWIATVKKLRPLLDKQSRHYPLVLAVPGPVFDFPPIDQLQPTISAIKEAYNNDVYS